MALPAKKKAAEVAAVDIGVLSTYQGGFGVPPGDYIFVFNLAVHSYKKKDGTEGVPQLGVLINCYPLHNPVEEEMKPLFCGIGKSAMEAYQPDETGKRLIPIPGAPAVPLNDQTNWALFVKSMYEAGLPEGVFTNDLSVLDGMHGHLMSIPEPESRRQMASNMSEVEGQAGQARRPQNISVLSEIKDDGKPWEGTGGFPEGRKPAMPKKTGPAPKAAPKAAPAKAAPKTSESEDENEEMILEMATQAATAVLEKSPTGMTRPMLRIQMFKHVKEASDADTATAVIDAVLSSDDMLNAVLEPLGYQAKGVSIKPLA